MTAQSMDLAWIVVNDFKAAVKFYTEVVGLQVMDINEEWGWAELQGNNGARLGIAKQKETSEITAGQNAIVTFTVKNLDESKAEMVRKGAVCVGVVQDIPGHVRMQLVRDLDGNQFQLVQMFH